MKAFVNGNKVENRKCGECHACCIRLRIPILNKEDNVPCINLVQIGEAKLNIKNCGIYENRPEPCRNFECVWLSGWLGGESHRPDQLGLMFTVVNVHDENVVHAWELKEDILKVDKVKRILVEMGRRFSFVFVDLNNKHLLIGSEDRNNAFRERHRHTPLGEKLEIKND